MTVNFQAASVSFDLREFQFFQTLLAAMTEQNNRLSAIEQKLDQSQQKETNVMAKLEDFQAKIDEINQNTSRSAAAAQSAATSGQAIAQKLTDLQTKLDGVLTDAGVSAADEQAILAQLGEAATQTATMATTNEALADFLTKTASGGVTQPEPAPVAAPPTPTTT